MNHKKENQRCQSKSVYKPPYDLRKITIHLYLLLIPLESNYILFLYYYNNIVLNNEVCLDVDLNVIKYVINH